jgi:hypothetical protein
MGHCDWKNQEKEKRKRWATEPTGRKQIGLSRKIEILSQFLFSSVELEFKV